MLNVVDSTATGDTRLMAERQLNDRRHAGTRLAGDAERRTGIAHCRLSAAMHDAQGVRWSQFRVTVHLLLFLALLLATVVEASDFDAWLSSEARAELIAAFEANDCRLTLTDVSDILFEYDASEQHIYTERLILIGPEQSGLSFPVVLIKSPVCEDTAIEPVTVAEAALAYAGDALTRHSCAMDIAALETLIYPADTVGELTATDRRNVVSELYNRGEVTLLYIHENGVDKIRVRKLTGTCSE